LIADPEIGCDGDRAASSNEIKDSPTEVRRVRLRHRCLSSAILQREKSTKTDSTKPRAHQSPRTRRGGSIGDVVALDDLPGVAQPAIEEGKYVAKVIKARLAGSEAAVRPFEYFDKGTIATIGHNGAVAEAFGVHVLYLIGWGNRFGTLYIWISGMAFARNRAHRLITL
jgi:hypothetical protein